jgi:hypothetical protein
MSASKKIEDDDKGRSFGTGKREEKEEDISFYNQILLSFSYR